MTAGALPPDHPLVDQPPDMAGPDQEVVPWRRLDRRMIFVDAVQALLSLVPMGLSVWVFGVSAGNGGLWPVLAVAVSGVGGAAVDAYRWAVTRFRITDELVEGRSGLFTRTYRSVRRDRIRTVDVHAKLRHRLGGLRVVTIGAGQQSAVGDVALDLDAVSVSDALALQDLLLHRRPAAIEADASIPLAGGPAGGRHPEPDGAEVLARFRPQWIVYNAFNIWAYVMAAGLMWGAFWLMPAVGIDSEGVIGGAVDWDAVGLTWSVVIVAVAATVIGVFGLAVHFIIEYWGFHLARVATDDGGTVLRTRHGLLTTREVARDEARMRGIEISEPLWWRWMGATDTTVITTGLDMSAMSQPAAVLPRTPRSTARRVAAEVVGTHPSPVDVVLRPHPRAALRRRLWWAAAVGSAVTLALGGLVAAEVLPGAALAGAIAVWPLALGGAVVAYRALGHTITGDHLVVRSGLSARTTSALQRSAVSTIAVRESVLQRRLGLRTVTAMTSAGHGAYAAPDLDRDDAVAFADAASGGLLAPFAADRST